MYFVWVLLSSTGIVLQLLLIHALTRGAYKRYPFLAVYAIILFLTTVVEAAAFYNADIWRRTSSYYWIVDSLRQVLIFSVVIALTYQVMSDSPRKWAVRRALIIGAFLFAVLSLYFTRGEAFGVWMARVGRNLGFCAVILNLVLWAVLIKFQRTATVNLMISGGLGIQMAGKAIGHSLRQLSRATTTTGDLIIVVSHLVCLYIWWRAFRGNGLVSQAGLWSGNPSA